MAPPPFCTGSASTIATVSGPSSIMACSTRAAASTPSSKPRVLGTFRNPYSNGP